MEYLANLGKFLFALLLCVLVASCTVYTEKQSEALSQTIYLADDSFELGRFDVTDTALDQAVRIVKPPKQRVEVSGLDKPTKPIVSSNSTEQRNRVVVVPSRFKGMEVIVVGSKEYEDLIKDQKNLIQLRAEHERLTKLKQTVDEELQKQKRMNDEMVIQLNKYKEEVLAKSLVILKLQIALVVLIALMGAGVYLRIKGIL